MKGTLLLIPAMERIGDLAKPRGAAPMPVEMVDLFEWVRRKGTDGSLGPMEQQAFKIGDRIRYATAYCKIGMSHAFWVAMNRNRRESLPPDMKKIFLEITDDLKERWAVVWNEIEIEGAQFPKKSGGAGCFHLRCRGYHRRYPCRASRPEGLTCSSLPKICCRHSITSLWFNRATRSA